MTQKHAAHDRQASSARAMLTPGGLADESVFGDWCLKAWQGREVIHCSKSPTWDRLNFYQQLDNLLFNLCAQSLIWNKSGFDTEAFVGFALCGGSASVWARGSELVWATVALERSSSSRIFFFFFCLFVFWFVKEIRTCCILFRTAGYLQFSRPDSLHDPNIFVTN